MTADETAASYGLVTNSRVTFLRSRNETLAFALVAQMQFSPRLDQQSDHVQHFRAALALAKSVSEWRNARVHPRVEFLDGIRPVLIGKDGKPLQIDAASCCEKIRQSSLALSELDAYTDRLATDAKVLEEMMNVELEQG